MQFNFFKIADDKTIGETLGELSKLKVQPEAIIVVDKEDKLVGQVHANELINANPNVEIKELVSMPFFVHEEENFSDIFRQFAHYNLRVLPVVGDANTVIGVISIDSVLHRIEEEEERDDPI